MGKKKYLNALDALAAIPDFSRLLRDASPALEFVRQHENMISQLTSSPVLDAIKRQDDIARQMTSSPVLDALRHEEEVARHFTHSPVVEAIRAQDEWLKQIRTVQSTLATVSLHGNLSDAARSIAATAAPWGEMVDRVTTDFGKLISESAFSEVQRVADSVRLSMPAIPTFDASLFTTNFDATLSSAVEQFRRRAEEIATDPEANLQDVETLVEQANAVAAAAPPESRAAMNAYVKCLLFWLLGVLSEDPVKAAAHRVLATLLIFLSSLQPLVLPEPPQPPASLGSRTLEPTPRFDAPGALALPDGWQIEGLPDVIKRAGPKAAMRTLEFFTANIRNPNTRQAYANAILRFFNWCEDRNLKLDDITPFAVTAYIEELQREASALTVKQHLAAIRMLFDWLVVGQVLPINPAASVRGPKHVAERVKSRVLTSDQARSLLDSIDTISINGLRDRALIGVMVYSFARVSAAIHMNVEDYYQSKTRWCFRFEEKDGKQHDVPAHHNAKEYLDAYLQGAGIADDASGPLFRTLGRDRKLTKNAMTRTDVLRMAKRRALSAGLPAWTCCHTFRATGITAYLSNGGALDKAQQIAAHESIRTTKLYDRTNSEVVTPDEIERIVI